MENLESVSEQVSFAIYDLENLTFSENVFGDILGILDKIAWKLRNSSLEEEAKLVKDYENEIGEVLRFGDKAYNYKYLAKIKFDAIRILGGIKMHL